MPQLDALAEETSALAAGRLPLTGAESEVGRVMQICNACRYCEGFCAVFPAMTRRLEFGKADIHYLANLCHNCGACLHACPYAPPHEFALNVPKAMASARVQTYADFAWPAAMGALYRHAGATVTLSLAAGLALFLVMALAMRGSILHGPLAGDFYAIFPHNTLAWMFGVVFAFSALALAIGVMRFWRSLSPGPVTGAAALETTAAVLRLKYLEGGHGEGCNESDDAFTLWRRRLHHFTFYGFMLCFASTCLAAFYHFLLESRAPYALTSLPVLLGTAGGIGLVIGPAGLLWLNLQRHPEHGDAAQKPMDRGFIAVLLLAGITGLCLLAWRASGAMALLLSVHLGVVLALFLTLPYGKFAHGVYRAAALLKYSLENGRPRPNVGGEL